MKVICSMVMTADGFIAAEDGQSVSSSLDWEDFRQAAAYHNNFIIGRQTLEASEPALSEVGCRFKIVVTTAKQLVLPAGFIAADSPQAALEILKDQVDTAYLAGGAQVNASFAQLGLITELIITVEPRLVGSGLRLFSGKLPASRLELAETSQLSGDRARLIYRLTSA